MNAVLAFPHQSIAFSRGEGVRDRCPEQRIAPSFKAFAEAILGDVGPAPPASADLSAFKRNATLPWCAPPLRGDGTRRAANAAPWPLLVLDVDSVTPKSGQTASELLRELVFAVREIAPMFGFTTLSHTDDAPRARLVLHLSRPVDANESKCLAVALNTYCTSKLGIPVGPRPCDTSPHILLDATMQDGAHIAFGPCKGHVRIALAEAVPPLDVETWLRTSAKTVKQNPDAIASFNGRPRTPETIAAMRDALARLDKRDPDAVHTRATWLRALLAIRAHDWGETGRIIAETWSQQSPKYDKDHFAKDWRSVSPDGKVSPSTLYWLAGPDSQSDCPDAASDDGMACRFIAWLGGRVIHSRGRFHIWTGSYWRPDHTAVEGLLKEYAKENARHALESFLLDPESGAQKHRNRAAKSLLSVAKQGAVLSSTRVKLTVPDDQLDGDPMLLAVQSGMVDLNTGELKAADPLAYCTRCAGVALGSATECPKWLAFLNRIFAGDAEVIAFLQRWMGYCLTGSMVEEKFLFGYGPTSRNGKTVLANVLLHIMGSYAVTSDPSLLMACRSDAGRASPELMVLVGARLCLLNESKKGDRLDDGTIKKLVSTERMTARHLHQNPVEFLPTAKLYLRSNNRPTVRDDTEGLWRRVMLLFFAVHIPAEQDDKGLTEKLKAEGSPILAWAVQGCLDWKRNGLRPPKCVTEATESYRNDSDEIGEWLASRTEGGGKTPTRELLSDYVGYAGLPVAPSDRAFAKLLLDRGYKKCRTSTFHGFEMTLKRPKPLPSTDVSDLC